MKVTYGRGYVYSLCYHIVFCVKYRHKVLINERALRIKEMFSKIAEDRKFGIITMEVMPDHVHLLIDCTPQHYIPDIIKILKGNTARWLFMENPELKQKLWGGHLWNPSYFVTTTVMSLKRLLQTILTRKKNEVIKLVQKAYEFRLYPTDEQKLQIGKTIGSSRYVYNGFLDRRKELYATEKLSLTYNQCSAILTTMKQDDDTCWLKEVDKFALQNSLKDLAKAYKNFFEGRAKFPCFKKKHGPARSYRTNYTNGNIRVNFDCHAIKLPKLGWALFRCSKKWTALPGKIINVTVRQSPSGKYFASVLCEADVQVYVPVTTKVGIDLGLKEFAITSSGEHVPSPKFFRESERKLAKLQRALSRTKKGSKNRLKARNKVARQHERITNQRKDFLHKYSHKVVSENQVIVLEGLRVKNMIKNRRLAKSIQDAGWSMFRGFVEYKARWYGRTYVEIDTFFPSSKLCSVCGTKNRMLTLDIRLWQCPSCQAVHDRDENASQNILNEGLRLLSEAV